MSPRPTFFVKETEAAKMLSMKPREFRDLVHAGALPGPRKIGPLERWDVEQIVSIVRGDAVRHTQELEL